MWRSRAGFGGPRVLQEADQETLWSAFSSRETRAVAVLSRSKHVAQAGHSISELSVNG